MAVASASATKPPHTRSHAPWQQQQQQQQQHCSWTQFGVVSRAAASFQNTRSSNWIVAGFHPPPSKTKSAHYNKQYHHRHHHLRRHHHKQKPHAHNQQQQQQQQPEAPTSAFVSSHLNDDVHHSMDQSAIAAATMGVNHRRRWQDSTVVFPMIKNALLSLAICSLVIFMIQSRAQWIPIVTNKERLQETVVSTLQRLRPSSDTGIGVDDSMRRWQESQAAALFIVGMAVWEMLGLSTIPVETAAGMVFGWPAAAYSLMGKLLGAGAAYAAGRTLLAGWAQSQFGQERLFQLLNNNNNNDGNGSSHRHHHNTVTAAAAAPAWHHRPAAVALLMKFSILPELAKNVGSSMLQSVQWYHFVGATALHGGMFTSLWTWLGVDTARRMHSGITSMTTTRAAAATATATSAVTTVRTAIPANRALHATLILAAVMGLIITPTLFLWWIRTLTLEASTSTTATTTQTSTTLTTTTTTTTMDEKPTTSSPI